MGTQTENYDLTLPSPEDYNIFKEHNENMIIIDSQLKKLEREKEAVIRKKSAFNKDFEADSEKLSMNGIADVGISDTLTRSDHVHPTDISRAATTHKHDGLYETPAGVQKKVDEHANQAEPHVGHISHSLATAPNDFLVASKAGRFDKRTTDEVKKILGFGTAAYTNVTDFATAEQGIKADNALPATAYTASDVLEKLKTVAGSGSKLDADLLDGNEASAFATAEQGKKADASAAQASLDAHMSDNSYPHGYPPVVNLLPDSGRFMGRINPLSCWNSANFAACKMFSPYNSASEFISAGKFIHNNSSYGGSLGLLAEDVIDLLNKMESLGVRKEKRYGVEFYIGQTTSGNGTYNGGVVKDYYLLSACNCMAFSGQYATSSFWIRVKNEGSMFILKYARLIKNGIIQNDNVILSSADGWTHIETIVDFGIGYDNGFPHIHVSGPGVVVQIAMPVVVAGSKGVGIHTAPVPTINELSI